jgi:AcrR family transcriptional regulator
MTSTPKIKKRDRERTKSLILKAVGQVINEHGTDKLGINLVARTAGVNKVLIYRYFTSIDGLMEQYVISGEYSKITGTEFAKNFPEVEPQDRATELTTLMHTLINDLRERKSTRDLLRWEIGTSKSMLSDARNEVASLTLSKIGALNNFKDTDALISLIAAGVYYLTISSDYRDHMINIDLQSEEGWSRIKDVIETIIHDAGK